MLDIDLIGWEEDRAAANLANLGERVNKYVASHPSTLKAEVLYCRNGIIIYRKGRMLLFDQSADEALLKHIDEVNAGLHDHLLEPYSETYRKSISKLLQPDLFSSEEELRHYLS